MILIEVEDNPNCRGVPQMSYAEIEPPRRVSKVRIERKGKVEECWLTGVAEGGRWVPATAQKVVDSGAAYAFLITGGPWGMRLQAQNPAERPWDLQNKEQWGEAYLLLGEETDLVFEG